MDREFALHLTDIRLLQTLRLLESTMKDHPDQDAVNRVLEALSTSRDTLTHLKSSPGPRAECCA